MGYDCAFTLRGSGARVFVFEYADMGYDCAALRGSGARVSVCGYADMGKACAFVSLVWCSSSLPCEADDWKIFLQLFPVPKIRWVCMHAELLVQQQRHYLR